MAVTGLKKQSMVKAASIKKATINVINNKFLFIKWQLSTRLLIEFKNRYKDANKIPCSPNILLLPKKISQQIL